MEDVLFNIINYLTNINDRILMQWNFYLVVILAINGGLISLKHNISKVTTLTASFLLILFFLFSYAALTDLFNLADLVAQERSLRIQDNTFLSSKLNERLSSNVTKRNWMLSSVVICLVDIVTLIMLFSKSTFIKKKIS